MSNISKFNDKIKNKQNELFLEISSFIINEIKVNYDSSNDNSFVKFNFDNIYLIDPDSLNNEPILRKFCGFETNEDEVFVLLKNNEENQGEYLKFAIFDFSIYEICDLISDCFE